MGSAPMDLPGYGKSVGERLPQQLQRWWKRNMGAGPLQRNADLCWLGAANVAQRRQRNLRCGRNSGRSLRFFRRSSRRNYI